MASLQIVQGLGAQHGSVVLSCGAIRLGRAEGRIEPCHGVSFNEAGAILGDSLSWTYPDPKHSRSERRWITVGLSETGRVLVVSHRQGRGGDPDHQRPASNEEGAWIL